MSGKVTFFTPCSPAARLCVVLIGVAAAVGAQAQGQKPTLVVLVPDGALPTEGWARCLRVELHNPPVKSVTDSVLVVAPAFTPGGATLRLNLRDQQGRIYQYATSPLIDPDSFKPFPLLPGHFVGECRVLNAFSTGRPGSYYLDVKYSWSSRRSRRVAHPPWRGALRASVPVRLVERPAWQPSPPPPCRPQDPELMLEAAVSDLTTPPGRPALCLPVRLRNRSWCSATDPQDPDRAPWLGQPATVVPVLVEGFTISVDLMGTDGRLHVRKGRASPPSVLSWNHAVELPPGMYVGACVPLDLKAMGVTEPGRYEVTVTYVSRSEWQPPAGGKKPWSGRLTTKVSLTLERKSDPTR